MLKNTVLDCPRSGLYVALKTSTRSSNAVFRPISERKIPSCTPRVLTRMVAYLRPYWTKTAPSFRMRSTTHQSLTESGSARPNDCATSTAIWPIWSVVWKKPKELREPLLPQTVFSVWMVPSPNWTRFVIWQINSAQW